MERKKTIAGKLTILKEIEPEYFDFIIRLCHNKWLIFDEK